MIEGKEKCVIIEKVYTEIISACQNIQTCERERKKKWHGNSVATFSSVCIEMIDV